MWINHSTCQDTICSSGFSNCTENVSEITLQAKIDDIESEQVVYPTSVGESFNLIHWLFIIIINYTDYNNHYFRPAVNQSSRCQINVQCLPILSEHQMCTIRYSTNLEYGNLSNPIMTPVGTTPVSLSHITPVGAMYYFEFSVLVTDTLLITERMEYIITESGGMWMKFSYFNILPHTRVHVHFLYTYIYHAHLQNRSSWVQEKVSSLPLHHFS